MLGAGAVYLNALHNPFVYDDYRMVVGNASILELSNVRVVLLHDIVRPLTNVTLAVDHAVWGSSPFGFHLTSVLLHMINVMLLFVIVRTVATRSRLVAGTAAWLFAVHPMMTEAVGYVAARAEVLCTTWFLLGILCGAKWLRQRRWRQAVLTGFCWVAGLATKESAVMLPFVLLACDRLLLPASPTERQRRLQWVHLPLIGVMTLAAVVRFAVLRSEYGTPLTIHWQYLPLAGDVFLRYLTLLVAPGGQAMFHDVAPIDRIDLRALLAIGVPLLTIWLVWRLRNLEPLAAWGLAWFLLALVPSTALIVLDRGELMVEHRVYLASVGLFLAAGATCGQLQAWCSRWRSRRLVPALLVALLVMSFGVQTWARNEVWASPVALWKEAVDLAPGHYRPRLLYGEALQDAGRRAEALDEYRRALQLRPGEPTAYLKMGQCLAEMGRLPEATAAFNELRARDPRSSAALGGLGSVAMLGGDPEQARRYLLDAIAADPRNVSARQTLAVIDETVRLDPVEALRLCEEVERIAPQTAGTAECIERNRARLKNVSR
jgi:tetratricopeptide (TPR) repeat protein